MARRKDPKIPDAILDQLLGGADPKTAFDPNGLLDDLKKALAERALNAEIEHHLANGEAGNSRNGYGKKTVVTDTARIELDVPRDRQSTFDPHLIAKYQRRFPGFDEKIISMYARGMSVREIVGHLRDLYGVDVSPDLISAVTDAVLDEVAAWQGRPLEPVYPLVFFDALRIKIRDEGLVRNKAVYVALGVLQNQRPGSLSLLQTLHKRLELGVSNGHEMFIFRIGAFFDVGAEFLERGDARALQPFVFGSKIAVDLGVARLMTARIAEHVLGEQILSVATGARPH